MKNAFLILILGLFISSSNLYAQNITLPQSSKKASVSEQIGLTTVTINYSRPGVNGRENKIWGALVPYNNGNPNPWRAGANENTTISFTHDVKIEGKDLPKGTYGLHVIPSPTQWTFIFSANSTSWGSYSYKQEEDALRVTVPAVTGDFVERLRYQFLDATDNAVKVELAWERKRAAFKVDIDVPEIVMANIRNELRSLPGFTWEGWNTAANYALQNNRNLEEALTWANRSISGGFGAQPTFENYSTKAKILTALNRPMEARAAMDNALGLANANQMYRYGNELLEKGQHQDALRIFEQNRLKNPEDNFVTSLGLAKAYKAMGDKRQAIKYFEMTAKYAPDNQRQTYLNEIEQLKR